MITAVDGFFSTFPPDFNGFGPNNHPRQAHRVHFNERRLLNTFAENGIPYNDDDDGLGLGESLSWEDIKKWVEAMQLVNEAVASLLTAQTNAEIAAATQRLYFEASRARDHESSAAYVMKRYGYSDGVNVPGIGRFRVRWLDDGMKILEEIP